MNRKEALDFLGLTEQAGQPEINEAIREKESYYKTLFDTAAIPKLKEIYQKNIQILEQVKTVLISQYGFQSPLTKNTTGYSSGSPGSVAYSAPLQQPNENSCGWLIRHTENMPVASYNLFPGENLIGREGFPGRNCIVVDDPYVSRYHARLIVSAISNMFAFEIRDDGVYSSNRISKNGTYINADTIRLAPGEVGLLKEGDTIQIGVTKFVLRINTRQTSVRQLEEEVSKTQYVKTVVIDMLR